MVIRMVEFGDNSGESIEEMISKVEQWEKDYWLAEVTDND